MRVSSKQKQRKAVERAKYESYLERKAAKARRQRRNQLIIGGAVVLVVLGGAVLWMSGVFSGDEPTTAEPNPSSSTPDPQQFDQPEQVLAKGEPATATMVTDQGDITVKLDTKNAPQNSNSIAFLAGTGYYDDTSCHRVTTSDPLFVLQCGDPLGNGQGSPGYTTKDENLPKAGKDNYPAGTVAMAESPQEGVPGGQFFVVYKDSTLSPDFTIVGQVTDGLDIVRTIAEGGVAEGGQDGTPAVPITIETVVVEQA